MLTAVDGIRSEIDASLSNLGANSFDINSKAQVEKTEVVKEKSYQPVRYNEVKRFKEFTNILQLLLFMPA